MVEDPGAVFISAHESGTQSLKLKAHVAQLVEHTLGKGEVSSSNLLMGSILL